MVLTGHWQAGEKKCVFGDLINQRREKSNKFLVVVVVVCVGGGGRVEAQDVELQSKSSS